MNDDDFKRHLQRLLKEWEDDKHLTTLQAMEKRKKKQDKCTYNKHRKPSK